MTITTVNLVTETVSEGEDGNSYERIYLVYYTGGYSAAALTQSASLPHKGSVHPADSNCYCTSAKGAPAGDGPPIDSSVTADIQGVAQWTVQYAPKTFGSLDLSPLLRPADIQWGGSDMTEVKREDVDGTAIRNSAGDYYDDLPEFFIRGGELTITVNEASNPASKCVNNSYTTNNAAWYGVTAGNALMGKITASKQQETVNGSVVTYWQVTYPITFRRDGWKLKVFDWGTQRYDDTITDLKATHIDMAGCSVPIFLDGAGKKLADGSPPVYYPTSGFRIYDESNFASLGLPNPFI